MNRKDTLFTAEMCVCGQREQDYGTPEDNFAAIAEYWNTYVNRACVEGNGYVFFTSHDVAVMMSLMKHGRITSGQPKADNYIDACGYLACASEMATEPRPVKSLDEIITEEDVVITCPGEGRMRIREIETVANKTEQAIEKIDTNLISNKKKEGKGCDK